jgi:hypothetical protein
VSGLKGGNGWPFTPRRIADKVANLVEHCERDPSLRSGIVAECPLHRTLVLRRRSRSTLCAKHANRVSDARLSITCRRARSHLATPYLKGTHAHTRLRPVLT